MPDTITNTVGMTLVLLPAGTFTMGGDWDVEQADENELPKHAVTFDKPFYIGQFTVTQAQWEAVMGDNPSAFKGDNRPVEMVSHEDAVRFTKRLNAIEGVRTYRLPTEAEWEYAARADSQTTYCYGPDIKQLREYAWFEPNSGGETHSVGQLAPNRWGLCDVHGNVHEWCADWYERLYYAESPPRHPTGPRQGVARVLRGGDWGSEAWYCRCAIRSLSSPQRRSPRVGFRVVKTLDGSSGAKSPSRIFNKFFSSNEKGIP